MRRAYETRLQQLRRSYVAPPIPLLRDLTQIFWEESREGSALSIELQAVFPKSHSQPCLKALRRKETPFSERTPLRVGVVFSGGPAAGGHNVIIGLNEAIKQWHAESVLFGFLNGPDGVLAGKYIQLEDSVLDAYRNQGGFDLLGSGRAKVETRPQLEIVLAEVTRMRLDGLVVIGGDDSNTNAAVMAEYFLQKGCATKVIGVPKTIDGDLKNAFVEIPFGFDTACKIYAEAIGNIARDALSSGKYYHFIRLMGRSASHIALECALVTQPNLAWIGEEIAQKGRGLLDLVNEIVDLVCARHKSGKHFGVILIPEGIIEWVPEMAMLIKELNHLLIQDPALQLDQVMENLSEASSASFSLLTKKMQQQLLSERDPHGNVQVSLIETEKLFSALVAQQLRQRSIPFAAVHHFLGYEGRAGFPSNFDSQYCLALGRVAALLVVRGKSGYMACVRHLSLPAQQWEGAAIPLVSLMQMETRKGVRKPVIKKALVCKEDPAFLYFQDLRRGLGLEDHYCYPGPIQFFGETSLTDRVPMTLLLNHPK